MTRVLARKPGDYLQVWQNAGLTTYSQKKSVQTGSDQA
jgi:hypothetical protein